jgi:hypothetical protein
MSDIGILNDALSIAGVFLIFGSPGFPLGAISSALLRRKHRVVGGLLGAVTGFVLWLTGWMAFKGDDLRASYASS